MIGRRKKRTAKLTSTVSFERKGPYFVNAVNIRANDNVTIDMNLSTQGWVLKAKGAQGELRAYLHAELDHLLDELYVKAPRHY